MKKLLSILAFITIISISAQATTTKDTLIADETTYSTLKTSVKIVSSNLKIIELILSQYDDKILSYTVSYKKDRMGRYRQYSIYLHIEAGKDILSQFKY